MLSESSKDSSSNGSVSSRLSFLFAHGHNTCRAPMEFANINTAIAFETSPNVLLGGRGGGMFFIVPFNPSPIHTRSLSSVGVTVCASCQALTCPMAAVFTHATRVQYVVAFQGNSPASVYSPALTTCCPPLTNCADCFSSGRSCWPCPSRSEHWQPGVQAVLVPPCRRVSPFQ